MRTNQAVLMLGSNMGDREEIISAVMEEIESTAGRIIKRSSVLESEPWGEVRDKAQNEDVLLFLNHGLLLETSLSPEELLRHLQKIEKKYGKNMNTDRGLKQQNIYFSRPIDIDIILFNDIVMDTDDLTIPHPKFRQREFVLRPLSEIVPEYTDPITGKSIAMIYEEFKQS